ncbi:MAG: cytochrome c [Burkholderiaceae bacterium]|nr:cytochrome c [Burkholderiaceae bacterium]
MARWTWTLLVLLLVVAAALGWQQLRSVPTDWITTQDNKVLAQGREIYDRYCASCHGANLEGQPDWTKRLASGRMPAPPHDASGHTWHHPSPVLFGIVKEGVTKYAPPGYESDMPAFEGTLTDAQIRAVLAYIRSTWPDDVKRRHAEIDARNR